MTTRIDQARGTLALLGGWELTTASGQAITFPAPEKGRALLAYLTTENRWHYRETLGELFWPDSPAPRANLRQALSVLRSILDEAGGASASLLIERNMVRFSANASFVPDVAVFTGSLPACSIPEASWRCQDCSASLERMAAQYKGPFMAGFSLPDCPEFEAWLQLTRETFHRRALSLFARLTACRQINHSPAAALAHALRCVDLDPWDETGQCRLMELHAAIGNVGAAIKQYEDYAAQLKAELGATPGKAMRDLHRRLSTPVDVVPYLPRAAAGSGPERRQIAVLYCEMTVADNDPEAMLALLQTPRQRVIDTIVSHGGLAIPSHGAGLLAYFGHPQSMKDAAAAAACAALAIVRHSGNPVGLQLGLHTGLTVACPNVSMPDAPGQLTVHAMRLCHAGSPGEIRLSGAIRALLAEQFECARIDPGGTNGTDPARDVFRLIEETGRRAVPVPA